MERYVARLVVRIFSICKDFMADTRAGGCFTVGCQDDIFLFPDPRQGR